MNLVLISKIKGKPSSLICIQTVSRYSCFLLYILAFSFSSITRSFGLFYLRIFVETLVMFQNCFFNLFNYLVVLSDSLAYHFILLSVVVVRFQVNIKQLLVSQGRFTDLLFCTIIGGIIRLCQVGLYLIHLFYIPNENSMEI